MKSIPPRLFCACMVRELGKAGVSKGAECGGAGGGGGRGHREQGECGAWLPRGYGRAGQRLWREYVFLTLIYIV